MDNLIPIVRSYVMSQIRSKNTRPEMIVRQFLHRAGYRFRLHRQDLPGRPDIGLAKYRTVILIHGCFWHAHPDPLCTLFKMPSTRPAWWRTKLNGNRKRDEAAVAALMEAGWKVLVVWECQLHPKRVKGTLGRIRRALRTR